MKKSILTCLNLLLFGVSVSFAQSSSNFFDTEEIQEIDIAFDQENWPYLLDSLRYNGEDMLLADVVINGTKFEDVGVRYRDGRSFKPGRKRNSLYIDLDFINKKSNFQGHRTVNLSSALRDPSMLREVLGYEIAGRYMPAPRANFARVSINDNYYGLYVNVEPVDEAFLIRHFQDSEGSLFLSRPRAGEGEPKGCKSGVEGSLQHDNAAKCYLHNFHQFSDSGWDDLIELTRILDEDPDKIEEILDVDNTLWMLAFNNVVVNLSSYTGQSSPNYFLYQKPDGRFIPILWDLNLAFGSYKNTGIGSDLSSGQLKQLDPLLHADNPAKPLISKLLKNDHYRKTYLSHLRTLMRQEFDKGPFEERARELQEHIRDDFEKDENRYYSVGNFSNSLDKTIGDRSHIPGLIQFMQERTAYLKRHAQMTLVPPSIDGIQVQRRPQFSSEMVTEFKIQASVGKLPRRVHLFYRFEDNEAFRKASMVDDGKHNDEEAGDGVYGISVAPENGSRRLQYFIMAENQGAVQFEPKRYMYEPLTANLDELNQ